MKIHQIWEKLHVSGHTRMDPDAPSKLKAAGIKTVFCVTTIKDLILESFMNANVQGSYIHFPLSDGQEIHPGIDTIVNTVIAAQVFGNVLIHCRAGRNRSCFVIALAMIKQGVAPGDAIDIIRATRPNALANPYFEEYLMRQP